MKKIRIDNPRFPHHVTITRVTVSDSPFDSTEERTVMYDGPCRSYTDTTVTGDANMDTNRRKLSIPVRFDGWSSPILDGDAVEAVIGNYTETGVVTDMEGDNNRTMVYWEYRRV